MAILSFYIHPDKETEFSNMHFSCTKNTMVEARLQCRGDIVSIDSALTEQQHPEESNPLATLILTRNTERGTLVIVLNYFY